MRVHFQVVEGTRRRTQVFEGVVLKQKGGGSRRTFTCASFRSASASSARFPCTRPRSSASRWSAAARSAGPSSTTCADGSARRAPARDARLRPGGGRHDRRSADAGRPPRLRTAQRRPLPRRPSRGSGGSRRRPRRAEEARRRGAASRGARSRGGRSGSRGPRGRRSRPPAEPTPRQTSSPRGRAAARLSSTGSVLRRIRENSLVELVLIVALAIGLALGIQAVLVKPYRIPSESMEPTLDVGQRVLVSRVNYHISDPDRGDVVVFHPPKGAEDNTCGAEHADNQLCPRPTAARTTSTSSSGSSPSRATPSRSATAARSSTASSRTSPISVPAHPEPAISRSPSRFRRATFL